MWPFMKRLSAKRRTGRHRRRTTAIRVDFDDIDAFVAALNLATSNYLAAHRGSFSPYDDAVITQILEEAIGDIGDDGDLDFDDIDDFVALLVGISGTNGELLPPALT